MSKQSSPRMSQQVSPRYDAAFKRRAVDQVHHHHQPVAQVARQLQCSPQSVANWVKQYQNDVRSNRPPNHSSNRSSESSRSHSPKSKSTLSHLTGQASSCQHKKPLSQCSRSVKASPRCTTFLPIEVGEMSSLVSHDELLMPRDESRIEIVTPSGLVLRFPGETALDVLAYLVRQLESASC